jgi:hypothetical protein
LVRKVSPLFTEPGSQLFCQSFLSHDWILRLVKSHKWDILLDSVPQMELMSAIAPPEEAANWKGVPVRIVAMMDEKSTRNWLGVIRGGLFPVANWCREVEIPIMCLILLEKDVMADITFQCPECQQHLTVDAVGAGWRRFVFVMALNHR